MQPLQNPSLCSSTTVTLSTAASFAQLSSANTHTQPEYDNLEFVPTNGLLSGLYLPSYHSLAQSAQKLRFHWKICVSNWLYVSSVYKKVNTNELLLEHTLGVTPERTSFILINLKVISMFELTTMYFYWLVPYLHSTPVLISKPSG
jgi:hypothetical protein